MELQPLIGELRPRIAEYCTSSLDAPDEALVGLVESCAPTLHDTIYRVNFKDPCFLGQRWQCYDLFEVCKGLPIARQELF